ncbi:MAG: M28 family peptidase [Gemmatimonadetes bacterium]|nr:M28 family peptidase [Gemmatimonadota bacterium]
MRILSVAATVFLLLGCSRGGEATFQFDGEAALSYAQAQMDFGERIPNTEGHRLTGDWILEQLESRADSVEVQSFTHVTADGDTLRLRNFIGRFRPDATERILFLAHWDTRPQAEKESNMAKRRLPTPGANDGASGVAILLGIADELEREPPAFGVDLLFVDGEDYGTFLIRTYFSGRAISRTIYPRDTRLCSPCCSTWWATRTSESRAKATPSTGPPRWSTECGGRPWISVSDTSSAQRSALGYATTISCCRRRASAPSTSSTSHIRTITPPTTRWTN